MCGIFGAVIADESRLRDAGRFASSVECLFLLSESRGKEAAGIAITNDEALAVYKAAQPAREMIRARGYRSFVAEAASDAHANEVAFIGHSRLVTDGATARSTRTTSRCSPAASPASTTGSSSTTRRCGRGTAT